MADPHPTEPAVRETADEARAGSTPGITRYILAISLVLIVVVYLVIFGLPGLVWGQ